MGTVRCGGRDAAVCGEELEAGAGAAAGAGTAGAAGGTWMGGAGPFAASLGTGACCSGDGVGRKNVWYTMRSAAINTAARIARFSIVSLSPAVSAEDRSPLD